MRVSERRSRIVYFRISEQEFAQLVRLCEAGGGRTVSDLLRTMCRRVLLDDSRKDDMTRLNSSMQALTKVMKDLTRQLRALPDTLKHDRAVGPDR
jgi:hypothetical protein